MQITLAAQQISPYLGSDTSSDGISALIPCVENSDGGPKCWLFSQPTTNTPFDFHIFIHYLQVGKEKPEEEDNGTNKVQGQCAETYFVHTYIHTCLFKLICNYINLKGRV